MDKLTGLYPSPSYRPRNGLLHEVLAGTKPDDPAVILYTSGSEGAPKGVALSHANLLANMYQACTRLDLMPCDILFNALPVFHSFGLTAGMLLPAVLGHQNVSLSHTAALPRHSRAGLRYRRHHHARHRYVL